MKRTKRNIRRYQVINSDLLNTFVAGITSRRDKALVMLLIDTGLRAGELIELDKNSITQGRLEFSDGSVRIAGSGRVISTKPYKERAFYLSARTVAALTDYLTEDRGDDGSPALFVSKSGTRLSSRAVIHMMYGWCDRIGIEQIGPYQLRHNFALTFLHAGGSPMALKRLLGFSGRDTLRPHCSEDVPIPTFSISGGMRLSTPDRL